MAIVLRDDPRQTAFGVRRQSFRRHALQRRGTGILLPAAAPPAGARQTVLLNDHVPYLACHTVGTVVDLSVMHDARAHAGAQRNGHEPLALPSRAHVKLRQCGAVGVVFDVERDIQIFVKQLPQRHIPQRQIARIRNGAGADVHRPRHPHAHACHLRQRHTGSLRQLVHHGGDRPRQRVFIRNFRHLHLLGRQQIPLLIHQARLQICASNVHSNVFHSLFASFFA